MNPLLDRLRHDAIAIYDAAVDGVEPRHALTRALALTPPPERVRLLAFGKAAYAMTAAAVQHLERLDIPVSGGVVITSDSGASPDPRLRRLVGDHPLPGAQSEVAAGALAEAIRPADPREETWLLLSGGTTSLIGAPVAGMSSMEYRLLMQALGRAGMPIGDLNRARKRFSRWGGGRLAAALHSGRTRVFSMSDVPGDRPEDIGSGPCAPDPTTASEVADLLRRANTDIPDLAFRWLDRVVRGDLPETPKPGDRVFDAVSTRVIGSNAVAREQAADRARALGYVAVVDGDLVTGEAAEAGRRIAARALALRAGTVWIGGGETTVMLGPDHGVGGRCQELALAAARVLEPSAGRPPVVVLAAGTDGRDGPTDAGGAVVHAGTWAAVRAGGLDPERSLARHDAYPALRAAGALLRPGLTGTNVMDVMIVVAGTPPET